MVDMSGWNAIVVAIVNMHEQMVETRVWKKNRGLTNEADFCRFRGEFSKGVLHLASWSQLLAGSQYPTRHNNVLKILMTAWAKDYRLLNDDQCCYKLKWDKGTVHLHVILLFFIIIVIIISISIENNFVIIVVSREGIINHRATCNKWHEWS